MPPTDPVDAHQMVSAAVPCAPAIRPNPRNNVALFKIFQNVQYNVVQHKKYVKEMTKLYKKLDQDMFRESFKNALQYLFTFGDTSANVDRVIQFVATFCTSLDEEDEFLMFIFDIIFECQCVSGQSVRYRASQLLAAVLSAMGEEACLDDDLCDKLLASQMQRLQDTRGAVRCRAALALQRLQNPPDDEVTRAYRFHMSCDPSSSVRRAVLMTIAKIRCNVPFVLERLCDIDEAVRRAAFLYMAAMNVTQLRVTQRVHTLKVGLTERSPRVRRVVEEILIPGWLSTFRGNIIDLLKAIRLDNSQDAKDSQYVAGKLLESLFKRLPISELLEWLPTDKTLRLIPADKLNKETAWYWRHLAQHLQAIEDDETLETVLPDLVVLIGYIRAVVESPCPSAKDDPMGFSTRQYVLHELASMLHVYDATDPAGRSGLQTLITDVLTGDYGPLNADVIRAFVSALELVVPEVSQRMEIISGVITSLRDPPEAEMPQPLPPQPTVDDTKVKLERARLRVSLNVAIEAQEEAVRDQNYALAAECKAKVEDIQKKLEELQSPAPLPPPSPVPVIREKLSDSDTLNKCLTILNSALDTPQVTSVTPMLQMIFKELEIEIFQNPDILQNAIETIALYAMLDKAFAKENVAFLFTNLIESNETIEATVLRSYVDILCVHGPRVFEETDSLLEDTTARSKRKTNSTEAGDITISDSMALMTPSHTASIEVLLKVLDDNCTTHRQIIVEGLCRLLHLGLLESPSILSRLLILWFNPATADEDLLRQTIGIFFETFPSSVDGAQEQIQKATIPTLRTLANAPSSSPLAEVDHEAVVRFIVSLTRINHELLDSQGGMAEVLSNHLVRRPDAAEVPLACRILSLLSPPREASLASQLAAVLREASLNLPDKQSCRYLTRYLGALEAAERASLNKMSNTGITDGTLQVEDTITQMGRATNSLPQPLARSTHVVINETVEEEVEIDETSPTEPASTISDVAVEPVEANPERARSSSESEADAPAPAGNESSDSGRGVSPVKKAKVSKGKKKLSLTKRSSENKKSELKRKQAKEKPKEKGVKRTRSQRSLVDVDRGQDQPGTSLDTKSTKETVIDDLDVSNVTVRKSTKGAQPTASQSNAADKPAGKKKGSGKGNGQRNQAKPVTRTSAGSSRSSAGSSLGLMTDDSADETELHTIVYDKEFEQSLLNDSGELADSKQTSKANVTIPETPEGSDESESEPDPEPVKPKGKRNAKKK